MSLEELFRKQGLPLGNTISMSKSNYNRENPNSFPIFNALVLNEDEFRKNRNAEDLWHGDLDLSIHSDNLATISREYGNIVVTNEQRYKIRTFRSNQFEILPTAFFEFLNKGHLGELVVRNDPKEILNQRTVDLNDLWKAILKYQLNEPTISPDEIKSVILFGSSVNKAPYETYEAIPFKFFKWEFNGKDYNEAININDVDICVLTEHEQEPKKMGIKLLDLGYPFYTSIKGNLDILYVTVDDFKSKLKEKTQNAMNIMKEGIILSDDGTFNDLKRDYERIREQKYVLELEFFKKNMYLNQEFNGKIKLNARLDFVGNIPYNFRE